MACEVGKDPAPRPGRFVQSAVSALKISDEERMNRQPDTPPRPCPHPYIKRVCVLWSARAFCFTPEERIEGHLCNGRAQCYGINDRLCHTGKLLILTYDRMLHEPVAVKID